MHRDCLIRFQCESQNTHLLVFKFQPVMLWIDLEGVSALEYFRWNDVGRENRQSVSFPHLSRKTSGGQPGE